MPPKLKEAIALFNRREYFTCHEILEELWQVAEGTDKTFYEALIRFATGLHLRFNRRSTQGAINLLTQGVMQLENYRPAHHGINVARLSEDINAHVNDLKSATSPEPGFFERWRVPRIHPAD